MVRIVLCSRARRRIVEIIVVALIFVLLVPPTMARRSLLSHVLFLLFVSPVVLGSLPMLLLVIRELSTVMGSLLWLLFIIPLVRLLLVASSTRMLLNTMAAFFLRVVVSTMPRPLAILVFGDLLQNLVREIRVGVLACSRRVRHCCRMPPGIFLYYNSQSPVAVTVADGAGWAWLLPFSLCDLLYRYGMLTWYL